MKKYNLYENNLDRTWYDSSNIVFSECIDNEGELKTVKVVFKGGRTYQYVDVKVNDYLMFRESPSQGKALNQYLKIYEAQRIEDTDVNELEDMLADLTTEKGEEKYILEELDSFSIIENGETIAKFNLNGNNSLSKEEIHELLSKIITVKVNDNGRN